MKFHWRLVVSLVGMLMLLLLGVVVVVVVVLQEPSLLLATMTRTTTGTLAATISTSTAVSNVSPAVTLLEKGVLDGTRRILISNTRPRKNSTGEIIDAHDGSYLQMNNSFYYYAMGYGNCKQNGTYCNKTCGYGYNWIGIWKSKTLATDDVWELIRTDAREENQWPDAVSYFRVHVIYKSRTKQYIMWVNVFGGIDCPKQNELSCYYVGFSYSPDGPFQYYGASTTRYPSPGDFDILVDDDDGDAYIIYTSTSPTINHEMSVEKLDDTWLQSAATTALLTPTSPLTTTTTTDSSYEYTSKQPIQNLSSGIFGNQFVEAPVIFKRKGVYYSFFGANCCFCSHGTGIGIYTSKHPLGPWKPVRSSISSSNNYNIGCYKEPKSGCGCGQLADRPQNLQ